MNIIDISIVVFGYTLSVFGGYLIINPVVKWLSFKYVPDLEWPEGIPLGAIEGFLDRFIFTSALLFGYEQFIAIWLAFKLAGDWSIASSKRHMSIYSMRLIGNGLSMLVAVAAALLIKHFISI